MKNIYLLLPANHHNSQAKKNYYDSSTYERNNKIKQKSAGFNAITNTTSS